MIDRQAGGIFSQALRRILQAASGQGINSIRTIGEPIGAGSSALTAE